MKILYVIRHAKSSWEEKDIADFDRPLNDRGERDAPFMGNLLRKINVTFDLVISSPAKRAYDTAKIICEKVGYKIDSIELKRELYLADVKDILEIIKNVDNKFETVAIFGHNPGFTDFVNYICDENIDNVPTCGIVKIELFVDSWKSLGKGLGKIRMFEYPKKYLQ